MVNEMKDGMWLIVLITIFKLIDAWHGITLIIDDIKEMMKDG